jgi:hypothetical protein
MSKLSAAQKAQRQAMTRKRVEDQARKRIEEQEHPEALTSGDKQLPRAVTRKANQAGKAAARECTDRQLRKDAERELKNKKVFKFLVLGPHMSHRSDPGAA